MNSYLTRPTHVARPRRRLKRPSGDPSLPLPLPYPSTMLLGVLGFRRVQAGSDLVLFVSHFGATLLLCTQRNGKFMK